MAVVPDRRKDCTNRLDMLKTNKMITIDALTQLVEQHDGRASKQIDKDDSKEIPGAFFFLSVSWVFSLGSVSVRSAITHLQPI